MKVIAPILATVIVGAAALHAADSDLKSDVLSATQQLANESGYSWKTSTRAGGGGIQLNPLEAAEDWNMPIISWVLAVSEYRAQYLGCLRQIAEESFDWEQIGPVVKQYRGLISDDVARDTRKFFSTEAFLTGTAEEPGNGNLCQFFDDRWAFLLQATAGFLGNGGRPPSDTRSDSAGN